MIDITNWREKELSLDEVVSKYPDVPYLLALKIDIKVRGTHYTERALNAVDPKKHIVSMDRMTVDNNGINAPSGFTFRDGTTVVTGHEEIYPFHREPYTIDYEDGHFYLYDLGKRLEEIFLWETPDFFYKKTSYGTTMGTLVGARPQRMDIDPNWVCEFWNTPKDACKYCGLCAAYRHKAAIPPEHYFEEITEIVTEALKQKGRFADIHMTGGSIITGKDEIFDDELELYIKTIQAAGRAFEKQWIPMQLDSSAFSERQLRRLKNETAITTYDCDLEVLNPEIFKWVCPGKDKLIGYSEWRRRIVSAVDIFGRGYVNSGIVVGVELAGENGFRTEDEAFEDTAKRAEELVKDNVALTLNVWQPCKGSILFRESNPSLEYYVRVARLFRDLHKKYHISIIPDDYRRCSNHMNMDFDRLIEFEG